MNCKSGPFYRHGFLRNASHTEDRYVCECEYHEPEIYWFNMSVLDDVVRLKSFLEFTFFTYDLDIHGEIKSVHFKYRNRGYSLYPDNYVAIDEEKTKILVCESFDISQ